jgi:hypothetical protein
MKDCGTEFVVSWNKRWDDRPLANPDACRHGGDRCLTIGQHLRPNKRGGHEIVLSGNVCMDCGIDTSGQLDRVHALEAVWQEHGWNRDVGLRLYALAEHHREFFMKQPSVPIWFAAAWDVPTQRIAEILGEQVQA